jgi:hypothetical protein
LGRAIMADANGVDLEPFSYRDNPNFAAQALEKVLEWSEKKKHWAREKHQELERSVQVKG